VPCAGAAAARRGPDCRHQQQSADPAGHGPRPAQSLEQQHLHKQTELTAALSHQVQSTQQHLQQLQQQVAAAQQQLVTAEGSRQEVVAEVTEKQHALQLTRGECASAQEKLSQVGLSSTLPRLLHMLVSVEWSLLLLATMTWQPSLSRSRLLSETPKALPATCHVLHGCQLLDQMSKCRSWRHCSAWPSTPQAACMPVCHKRNDASSSFIQSIGPLSLLPLHQLQTALIDARRQLETLQHSTQQQQRQAEEASEQLASLQAQRAAAAAEAAGAQQELSRVLRELEHSQQVSGVGNLVALQAVC